MGLVHGVPEGGTVWEVPSARSAHARLARFFPIIELFELNHIINVCHKAVKVLFETKKLNYHCSCPFAKLAFFRV